MDVMCDVLQVSRSGYYAWRRPSASAQARRRSRADRADPPGAPRESRRCTARRGCMPSCGPRASPARENTVAKLMRKAADSLEDAAAVRGPHHRQPACASDRAEPAEPAVRTAAAQSGLGRRHHLHPHWRRLAVPGGGARSVLAEDRGLGRPDDQLRAELPCRALQMAIVASPARADAAAPQRSRRAVRLRRVPGICSARMASRAA